MSDEHSDLPLKSAIPQIPQEPAPQLSNHPNAVRTRERRKREYKKKGDKQKISYQESERLSRMVIMHAQGHSDEIIGKALDIPRSTVADRLKKFEHVFAELANVKDFRKVKSDLLDAAQLMILKSALREELLQAASLKDHAYAFDILYRSNRLEQNLSTQNTQINAQFTKLSLDQNDE